MSKVRAYVCIKSGNRPLREIEASSLDEATRTMRLLADEIYSSLDEQIQMGIEKRGLKGGDAKYAKWECNLNEQVNHGEAMVTLDRTIQDVIARDGGVAYPAFQWKAWVDFEEPSDDEEHGVTRKYQCSNGGEVTTIEATSEYEAAKQYLDCLPSKSRNGYWETVHVQLADQDERTYSRRISLWVPPY